MDQARWDRIQSLFHTAAELPQAEQRPFLESQSDGDPALLAEVLAMLKSDRQGKSVLDDALPHLAHEMLTGTPNPAPKNFGPYRIDAGKLLGEGGMGVVYLAERTDLGIQVALKFLRDIWLSAGRRGRFAEEQRTLARLNHPNIARVYDAGALPDGTPWFAMEYVEGVRLTDYCRDHASSIEERLRLFRAVCDAVQHAHAHFVVHRDLKPSNILVKADGTPKLLDFGIATQIENLEEGAEQTRTVLRLMTPAYASPEQLRGEFAGASTDVYSLGVVLYELLTGRLPFDLAGCSAVEVERIVVEQEPARPSVAAAEKVEINKAGWADLDVLCLTAMHKDAQRRYKSVEALIRDIDHYLNGEPLEARPDSLRYRAGKFWIRHRRGLIAAAAIVTLIVGLVVFDNIRLRRARDAARDEAARTKRVEDFLVSLLIGGDSQAGPSRDLKVVTILDRGSENLKSLNDDPGVEAQMLEAIGTSYQALGELAKAQPLLEACLQKRRMKFGQNSIEVAQSLFLLGVLRLDQNRFADATPLISEARALFLRLTPNSPDIEATSVLLGRALESQGLHAKAVDILQPACQHLAAPKADKDAHASCLVELGGAQMNLQHPDAAESLDRQALAIWKVAYGERHPNVADALLDIGQVDLRRGRFAAAETEFRQALDIDQTWYGKDHPRTAVDMAQLAEVLAAEEQRQGWEEAEQLISAAIATQTRLYPDGSFDLAADKMTAGTVAIKLGNLKIAESRCQGAVETYRKLDSDHEGVGMALSCLGDVYLHAGKYSRAETALREAILQFSKRGQQGSVSAGKAYLRLGRALLLQHRYTEAEPETLQGYNILARICDPSVNYLVAARADLAAIYTVLGEPEKAAQFRTDPRKS